LRVAIVLGLLLVFPPWLAALSVGVLVALVAAILVGMGRNRLQSVDPKLKKTVETMKEDVQWLKDQTR
jgi:hypothetical protein